MKISGGAAKGIPLQAPKGTSLRPASGPARERLFSSLGGLVSGASFLDLFAGTGSYGLEALSRGARRGAFVEHDARVANCLRRNLEAVCKSAGVTGESFEVIAGDVLRVTPRQGGPFDLVFADPPYPVLTEIAPKMFARLLRDELVGETTLLALELPGEIELAPKGWILERRLGKARKGSPTHGLFRIA